MSNLVRIQPLDRLSAIIPLVDYKKIDIRQPSLVRVLVDSSIAIEMLDKNVKNRRQRRAAVEYLKHQIKSGEWRDDHPQPVIFSDQGRLIDGQHRIQAIAESDLDKSRALIMRVETGARDDVREYLDTGVPRSLDDRVELVEDTLYNKIIAQLCGYNLSLNGRSFKRPSPEDAKEFFAAHVESSLFVAKNMKRDRGVGRIQVAFAAMEYYERSPEKAEEFYPAIFVVDSNVQQARVLRDHLLRLLGSTAMKENTMTTKNDIYYKSVGCMKAHSIGRTVAIVRKSTW